MHPDPPVDGAAAQHVVLVACGARKTEQPSEAGSLYVGGYHRAARRAADALTAYGTSGLILIISARHGLLDLNQVIAPYEQRLGRIGSITARTLHRQAGERGLLDSTVTVLAGRGYVELARRVWPSAAAPLLDVGGIGQQLAALSRIARGETGGEQ